MLHVGRASNVFAIWRQSFVRVMPAACHAILSPLDDHALLICMLYNFCYVMTTLCISYCDVALCRDLMSDWKWLRFCVAGNHINLCLVLCLFLYVGILLCMCVCVYMRECICLYLSLCVYMQAFSVKQINPCPTKWLGSCSGVARLQLMMGPY